MRNTTAKDRIDVLKLPKPWIIKGFCLFYDRAEDRTRSMKFSRDNVDAKHSKMFYTFLLLNGSFPSYVGPGQKRFKAM